MLVSNVDDRVAVGDRRRCVCAARWKTVSISYSPSTRSSSRLIARRRRGRSSRARAARLRTSSLAGTQSRTRQTTSAPASSSRRTSQPPTSPVAPVTSVGRSRQNAAHRPAPSTARSPLCPEALEQPLVAQRVHALPEAVVPVGGELAVGGQPLERVGLEARRRRRRGSRSTPGSRTKKPPLIQPSPICGFSVNSATRSPSNTRPPKRAGGRTAVTVASLPCARWKASSALEVDVAHAVAVGQHERAVAAATARSRFTRPPVLRVAGRCRPGGRSSPRPPCRAASRRRRPG